MGKPKHTPRNVRLASIIEKKAAEAQLTALLRPHLDRSQRLEHSRLGTARKTANRQRQREVMDPLLAGLVLRDPAKWRDRGPKSTLRHRKLAYLYGKYPVPAFLANGTGRGDVLLFIHLAQGGSVLTAPGLPTKLTKRMAHEFMQAPAYCTLYQAVRWAQVRAAGGDDNLAFWVAFSLLGEGQFDHDGFWLEFMALFARQAMFDNRRVPDVVRYLHAQKFERQALRNGQAEPPPEPGFSLRGRTATSLLRLADEWLREFGSTTTGRPELMHWGASMVRGAEYYFETPSGELELYQVRELLSGRELHAEGHAMHHCVFSYAEACLLGQSAIFSLTVEVGRKVAKRLATIEVDIGHGVPKVVQVRAKCNASLGDEGRWAVRRWMQGQAIGATPKAFVGWDDVA
jgi:hypothetical protein